MAAKNANDDGKPIPDRRRLREISVMSACPTGVATWAALSTSGIKALELPGLVHSVIIAADRDDNGAAGEAAANIAAERWAREGRSIQIVLPPRPFNDFNDALRAGDSK